MNINNPSASAGLGMEHTAATVPTSVITLVGPGSLTGSTLTAQTFSGVDSIIASRVIIPFALTLIPTVTIQSSGWPAGGRLTGGLWRGADKPTTQIADFGEFDVTTTGTKVNSQFTVQAGEYWLVVAENIASGAANTVAQTSSKANFSPLARYSSAAGTDIVKLTATQTYAYPLNLAATVWANSAVAVTTPFLFRPV